MVLPVFAYINDEQLDVNGTNYVLDFYGKDHVSLKYSETSCQDIKTFCI
jgi:hypothetical protein